MKTFNEILQDIKTTYEAIKKSEANEKRLEAEWTSVLGTRYNQDEIIVYPSFCYGNDYSITIGTKYIDGKQDRILIDNKIQLVPLENFCLWYIKDEYISDIPAAIADMKELYNKAVSMQKELDKVCSAFNKYTVDGIEPIYCDKRIFERMLAK